MWYGYLMPTTEEAITAHLNPEAPWSDPTLPARLTAVFAVLEEPVTGPAIVAVVMPILEVVGYDSVDREEAFCLAERAFGLPYEAMYHAWLRRPIFVAD